MRFEHSLKRNLDRIEADLPSDLWWLIRTLEEWGQCFSWKSRAESYLSLDVVKSPDELRSFFCFILPETDYTKYMLGKEGYEKEIFPIIRCAGDGSHLGIWRRTKTDISFVFMGSDGECFVVTDDVIDFIFFITSGYHQVEGKSDILKPTKSGYEKIIDSDWEGHNRLKSLIAERFNRSYPSENECVIEFHQSDDPFEKYIEYIVSQ